MAATFTLTTPVNVGTLMAPRNVSSLIITSVWFSTTPQLAPIGSAELDITITDPNSGWQETITYSDCSVTAFFNQIAPIPSGGATFEDVMARAVFGKLVADGKLPPGTLS